VTAVAIVLLLLLLLLPTWDCTSYDCKGATERCCVAGASRMRTDHMQQLAAAAAAAAAAGCWL